jgi:DNA-binding transcriptional MerR regulator
MTAPREPAPSETYTIGEFARLSGVTPKALRHYDRVGALRPAVVDRRTRYRRYTAEQLGALYEVLALSRLGLTLRQVRDALGARGASSLGSALVAARQEIETRIAEDRARLAWIERRLGDLAAGPHARVPEEPPAPAVVLKEQPSLRVLAVRERIASYAGADELLDVLAREMAPEARRERARGAVWHDCGSRTGVIDCEAFVLAAPRARGAASRGRVRDLPAATLACAIHRGDDNEATATYAAAHRWIAAHGFTVAGPNREWYLGTAGGAPIMEIQVPVRRAAGR